MAVVLPIHSHIGFSDPTDKDYQPRCQNEENEGGERIEVNDFMHNEIESESPGDNSRPCSISLVDEESNDRNSACASSMNIDSVDQSQDGGGCDGFDDKPNALPLTLLGQNDTGTIDDTNDVSDFNLTKNEEEEEKEKEVASSSVDNYWLVDNEIENEMPELGGESGHEIENAIVDENSSVLSSLKAVDIASPVNIASPIKIESEDQIDSNSFTASNLFNPLALVETNRMEVERDETKRPEHSTLISAIVESETNLETEPFESLLHGGLQNLGNTCYMASALQLLCGLDSFPSDLKSVIPPENSDGNANDYLKSKTLRESLIDVMDRLGNGETVRPYDLKRCIDSRTALFLGYHQQDSHEFLTTLLDMLDEDYKIKPNAEETTTTKTTITTTNDEKEETSSDDDGNDSDETMDNNSGNELMCDTNDEQLLPRLENNEQESNNDEKEFYNNDDDSDQESLESAQKRQKVVEEETLFQSENEISAIDVKDNGDEPTNTGLVQRSKSYSNFKFSDIESLLHDKNDDSVTDNKAATTTASSSSVQARQDEPKCKLAGGRMSTSGVELTRFVEDGEIDENSRPTDACLDRTTPQQQIVEGEDQNTKEEKGSDETSLSPISSNFTTKVRVCLTCESCKFRRSHIETYLHISLDIGTGSNGGDDDDDGDGVLNLGAPSSSSIEEGLRKFFAPEKRDIKCEKCFHTSALQTSEITQLPRNLLFHLKRFIVDVSPDYSSISYRKDQSPVIFEERIKLEGSDDDDDENHHNNTLRQVQHDDEGCLKDFLSLDCSYSKGSAYEIRSVVNHIGSSASCGHYTADAKRRLRKRRSDGPTETGEATTSQNEDSRHENNEDDGCDETDRQWMRFNDSYVSKISSKEAVKDASQTAYMIMYELVQ